LKKEIQEKRIEQGRHMVPKLRDLDGSNEIIRKLNHLNLVKFESNKLYINRKFEAELNDFISYLKLI